MHFTIAADHPSLAGHFPGRPIVPGVVVLQKVVELIEAGHGPLPPLQLPQVKFLRPLLPGEEALVELQGAPPRWRFRILCAGQLLASGEISTATPAVP